MCTLILGGVGCRLKTNVFIQRLGVRWGLKFRNRHVLTLSITPKTENERLLLSASFTAKFELVFVLARENTFLQRFCFKTNRKSMSSSIKLCCRLSKQPSVWEIGMF